MQVSISEEVKKEASNTEILLKQVRSLEIKSNDDYVIANERLKEIKKMYKNLDEQRKSVTMPIDQAKKSVMDFFRKPLSFLNEAESVMKKNMIAWSQEQERALREQERIVQEKARKEEEKKRVALEAKAAKAEARGREELAADLREEAEQVSVAAPVIETKVPKAQGASVRKIWKARVVDIEKLPKQFLVVDQKKLDGVARATKGSLPIAGVQFYVEESLSVRA